MLAIWIENIVIHYFDARYVIALQGLISNGDNFLHISNNHYLIHPLLYPNRNKVTFKH